MNRKWSYVAAMMLTASCGCLFTGCIDNDEPYGIEQIRVATADLLKAKQAAVAAQAAADNAAAEVAKLEIELKKTELEIAKIKAQAEADAIALQAEADAAKTQAEADLLKAKAQAVIEEAQAKAYAIKAKADAQSALVQQKIDEANFHLNKLKEEWEAQKIHNAAADNDILYRALANAYNTYIKQLDEVNTQTYNLSKAQQAYAKAVSDLVWNKNNNTFESKFTAAQNKLQGYVDWYTNEIENGQKSLATLQEAKTAVENSDLSQLLDQYKAQYEENVEALAKAEVEKEAIYIDHQAEWENLKKMEQAAKDALTAKIAIAPYTYVPDANLSIPGYKDEIYVVKENVSYTLAEVEAARKQVSDPKDAKDIYDETVKEYTNMIAGMTNALLDENDKAWTQASLTELERRLAEAEATEEGAIGRWKNAKLVYNNGNPVKAEELPLEKEVEEAIAAYNALGEKYAADVAAYNAIKTNQEEAQAAYNQAVANVFGDGASLSPAAETYYEATLTAEKELATANTAYTNAVKNAAQSRDTAIANADATLRNANNATARAEALLEAATAEAELDPNNLVLKQAKEDAKAAYDAAKKVSDAAPEKAEAAKTAARTAYNQAMAKAQTEKVTAENKAKEKLDQAYATYVNTGEPVSDEIQKAYAALQDANKKADDAVEAQKPLWEEAQPVWEAYNTAIANQLKAIGLNSWRNYDRVYDYELKYWCYGYYVWDDQLNQAVPREFKVAGIPIEVIEKGVYVNAKQYLTSASQETFGNLLTSYDPDKGYPELDNEAMLIDNVTNDMVNEYLKKYFEDHNYDIKPYDYYQWYSSFGAYGDVLYLQDRIAIAKISLTNADVINEVTKQLSENLAVLEKDYNDAVKNANDLADAATKESEKLNKYYTEIDAQISVLKHENGDLEAIISAIETGLDNIINIDTPEGQKQLVYSELDSKIKETQGKIEDAQEALAQAQKQLDEFNEGNYYNASIESAKNDVAYWTNRLNREQQLLEFYKARVNELQTRYDKATGNNGGSTEE